MKGKNNTFRITLKPYANLQTITKMSVKFNKDQPITVRVVEHTRYPLSEVRTTHYDITESQILCPLAFHQTRGLWWPYIAHLNHVIHTIANRDAVLKVMVALTMTFALRVIFWSYETSLLCLRVLAPSIAKSLFCTRGHCDLDLCHQGHLLVKTNIPSTFKGSSLKHLWIISFLVLKVMETLTMTCALVVIYWWGPTFLLSLRVLAPKHCQVIKLFSTKGPGDIYFCPQDHLLVRTNISTVWGS